MPGPVAAEKLSSFVYKLHQPTAQQQKSCLKDTTYFINFLEKRRFKKTQSLFPRTLRAPYIQNIPQEERINLVCNAYKAFHGNEPPIPL